MQKKLIICMTPLQILIAKEIVLKKGGAFDFILIGDSSEKNFRYFNQLKELCDQSLFFQLPRNIFDFFSLKDRAKKIIKNHYHEVYAANIDRKLIQYFFSCNFSADFYTFDDGVGNIVPNSFLTIPEKQSTLSKVIWRLLGIKLNNSKIRSRTIKHYTIFKNITNIVDEVEYVSVFKNNNFFEVDSKNVVKVFVGQPMFEVDEKYNYDYINKLLKELKIDYYFPHPRESVRDACVKVIETAMIFEDYIIEMQREKKCKLEVYSFSSTAIINLHQMDSVDLFYVTDEYLISRYGSLYDMAKVNFKINILKFE